MSSVVVACPKCKKRQPIGGAIPPEGLRHTCPDCGAQFRVKLPANQAAARPAPAPAPPPEDAGLGLEDLGKRPSSPLEPMSAREAARVPPAGAQQINDAPTRTTDMSQLLAGGLDLDRTTQDPVPGERFRDMPVSRAAPAPSRPAAKGSSTVQDLPAARDPFRDLPAARAPGDPFADLPAARAPNDGFQDLPAARAPGDPFRDLPAARAPGDPFADLPAARAPDDGFADLPAARAPDDGFQDLPAARAPDDGFADLPAARAPDDGFQDLPAARAPDDGFADLPAARAPDDGFQDLPAARAPDDGFQDLPAARDALETVPSDFLEPAGSESDDLPASRDGIGDLPVSRQPPRGADLPVSRQAAPRQSDSPAPRESVPRPGDLPAARESVPRPGDLPAARESMPRPGDLPAARESVPRPGDLPAARESMPRPGDFPVARESMPRPGDFPVAREAMPRPGDLPIPRESMPLPGDFPIDRDRQPRPGDLPIPRESMPLPGDFPIDRDQQPRPGDLPVPRDDLSLPDELLGFDGGGAPAPLEFDPFRDAIPGTARSPLEGLELGDGLEMPGATLTPAAGPGPEEGSGFGLALEGAAAPAPHKNPPSSAVRIKVPPGIGAPGGDQTLTPLAPLSRRQPEEPVAEAPRPRKRLYLMAAGAAAGLVLVASGVLFALRAGRLELRPDEVLGALAADVTRDQYAGYQTAADALVTAGEQSGPDRSVAVRAAAAEALLVSALAHGGDKTRVGRADQLVKALPDTASGPYVVRARALQAIARGRFGEIKNQLGPEGATPEGFLVLALRDHSAGKPQAATAVLRQLTSQRPDRALGWYLLGRSLEGQDRVEATRAYQAVLSRNPGHFGAALGTARLTEKPDARLAALQQLVEGKAATAPKGELSDAYVALGQAAAALGRSAEATTAYTRALATEPASAAANLALGEAQMSAGRYQEALQRFQAAGSQALATPAGKFALGSALIATGNPEEGLGHVRTAAEEDPRDPRGVYLAGFASELGSPPDLEAAAQNYRAALKLQPGFLPASLRLAALDQRQGKPQEALDVLKSAEEAGAPPGTLQIAFGEALIQAKEPARAEEVFRKLVAASPEELSGHLGLASALDAAGNTAGARQALQGALDKMPDSVGLRERMGDLSAKMGHPDQAMTDYRAEIATGKAPPGVRVSLAKLELAAGQLEEAATELGKVIDENPATPGALFTLGRVWEARNDLPRAIQEYRRATRFENTPVVQLAMARALLKAGKEGEAAVPLDAAAATLPDGLIERGRLSYRKGEYDRALGDFQAAAKLSPKDPQGWLWQGLAQDKMGEAELAAEAWKKALALAPNDAESRYRLGRFELDRGRAGPALEHLRKAAGKVPEKAEWEADLYFQLGTAEQIGGNRTGALAAFKKYLQVADADAPARPEVERQVERWSNR